MYYIVGITEDRFMREKTYEIFDTHTNSVRGLSASQVIELAKSNEEIGNAFIDGGKVEAKGYHPVYTPDSHKEANNQYTLVKIMDGKYKVVTYYGAVTEMDKKKFIEQATLGNISNVWSDGKRYETLEVYETIQNKEFEEQVNKEYDQYIAKSKLLGKNASFIYTIEGYEVKLYNYTGDSSSIVIPNFITTIMMGAFYNKGIESIKLNNGLKYIGDKAFEHCNISELTIPKTVKVLGTDALTRNKHLFEDRKVFNSDRVKILNDDIIIYNQCRD